MWGLFPGNIVGLSDGERTELIQSKTVILAPGATDLHLAFPGWTLGGVLGGLGAWRLLETYGYLDAQRMLILGDTPLASGIARRAAAAGTEVVGIVDVAEAHTATWSRHTIREARGAADVEEVTLTSLAGGPDVTLSVDSVCVAIGQLPAIELAAIAGCALAFDVVANGNTVIHDAQQRTTRPGVFVADSDGAGERAAQAAARWLRQPSESAPGSARPRITLPAGVKDAYASRWHQLADQFASDDVVVCRCEEITRGELLTATDQEHTFDPNELKRVSRAGMGLCQGRGCRPIVAGILANRAAVAFADIPLATYRPQVRPVPLRALATEELDPDAFREPIQAANFRLPSHRTT